MISWWSGPNGYWLDRVFFICRSRLAFAEGVFQIVLQVLGSSQIWKYYVAGNQWISSHCRSRLQLWSSDNGPLPLICLCQSKCLRGRQFQVCKKVIVDPKGNLILYCEVNWPVFGHADWLPDLNQVRGFGDSRIVRAGITFLEKTTRGNQCEMAVDIARITSVTATPRGSSSNTACSATGFLLWVLGFPISRIGSLSTGDGDARDDA